MVVARRDFAERLKDSVSVPVVESEDIKTRELKAPPELPEDLSENRTLTDGTLTEHKNTTTTTRRRKRTTSGRTARRKT
jgi:hypothetical protein